MPHRESRRYVSMDHRNRRRLPDSAASLVMEMVDVIQGEVYLPGPVSSTQLSTSRLPGPASALSVAVWNSVSVHSHSIRKSLRPLQQPWDGAPVSALCKMYEQVCRPSH